MGRLEESLELFLVISVKVVEVLDLVTVGLFFSLRSLGILSDNLLDGLLQLLDVLVVVAASLLQISNVLLHLILTLLSHQGLSHAVGDRGLVQGLVSLDGHLDFITDTHEKETTLSTIDSDLSDKLIKTLGEKFFTEGANSSLSSLSFLNGGIKLVLQVDNVDLRGGLGRNVTHPEGSTLGVLSGRQDGVEIVLVALLLVLASLLHLVHGGLLLALGLLVGDAC